MVTIQSCREILPPMREKGRSKRRPYNDPWQKRQDDFGWENRHSPCLPGLPGRGTAAAVEGLRDTAEPIITIKKVTGIHLQNRCEWIILEIDRFGETEVEMRG